MRAEVEAAVTASIQTLDDRELVDEGGDLRGIAMAFLISALGVAVVAASYAMARQHVSGATPVLWTGQIIVFAPLVFYVLSSRRLDERELALLGVVVGLVPYMIKIVYSPVRLTFNDELQHRLGTLTALHAHVLGHSNQSLPISAKFPGMESLGAAFAAMTGLSVDASAMIITGLLKICTTVLVSLVLAEATRSNRIAAVGLILYCANGTFEFFSSFYIYENLAFPLALTTLYLALRLRAERAGRFTFCAAVMFAALTTLSHHATAIFLDFVLVSIAAYAAISRERKWPSAAWLASVSVGMTAAWFLVAARSVTSYLRPYVTLTVAPVDTNVPLPGVHLAVPTAPVLDQLFNRLGLGLTLILVVLGFLLALRGASATKGLGSFRFAFALLAAATIFALGLAVAAAYGYQIASRSQTYTYLGSAAVGAPAVLWAAGLTGSSSHARPTPGRRTAASIVVLLCIGGGAEFGWPAWWEKLPGTYHQNGYESGLDPHTFAAAAWVEGHIPRDARFAADSNGETAVSTIANREVEYKAASAFYETSLTPNAKAALEGSHVRYVWADLRVAQTTSPSARYFGGPLGVQYTFPPSIQGMTKWSAIPHVNKVYDDGTISIYDLKGTTFYG